MPVPDIYKHIGQFAIVGFDGHVVPPELRALVRQFDLGGVIFFARNIEEPEQVAELSQEIQSLGDGLPLWVSIDQEGGRVARLRQPFTEWPPMQKLGQSGSAKLARRFASALAKELAAVGISLNYAPVLDVHSDSRNTVIGDRALSEDAEMVAKLGAEMIRTFQSLGIAACGKHFPGHGDTSRDSHHELPCIETDAVQLNLRELLPFRAAIEADVAAIMTGHLLVPALDDKSPATLSRSIVDGLLRKKLGYDGLIVTDDLGMKAVAATHPIDELAVSAVGAGCDLLLLCPPNYDEQANALESLIHAVESNILSIPKIEAAMERQVKAKVKYLQPRVSSQQSFKRTKNILGCEEALAIVKEIEQDG